jgi:hypothetical protein
MNFFLAILIFVDARNWVFLWATGTGATPPWCFVCVILTPGIMDCQRTVRFGDKE